ncbi:MAG: hypothetical protein WAK48_17605 [Candidatus Acidiferrum sp.]
MVYVCNVTGRALRSAEAISKDLATNIAHGVRWYDATTVLEELGCRLFLEMPPGHVLSELGREAFADVRTLAIGETSLTHAVRLASQFDRRIPTGQGETVLHRPGRAQTEGQLLREGQQWQARRRMDSRYAQRSGSLDEDAGNHLEGGVSLGVKQSAPAEAAAYQG